MKLLADCGNQYIKWRFGEQRGRFLSSPRELRHNLESHWGCLRAVDEICAANVAGPEVESAIAEFAFSHWGAATRFIASSQHAAGVSNGYADPGQLGADRWAAIVAAWHHTRQATVAVDCGTAITVDAVKECGEFVGGSIMPGFAMSTIALIQNSSNINSSMDGRASIPGRSTAEAVRGGTLIATIAGVDELVGRYRQITGSDGSLIATGADAALLNEHSRYQFELIAELVLDGIEILC